MLNYNCSNLVLKAINTFKNFKNKIELFIVDNNSNESNKEVLKKYEEEKDDFVHIFYNEENLGFAKGNNVALKKIEEFIKCDNVFILNPDVYINEDIIEQIDDFIKNTNDCGAVSIEHKDGKGGFSQRQGWDLPDYRTELKTSFYFLRKKYYKKIPICYSEKINKVDAIDGCFYGINYDLFKSIGFLDENTFLYYEENILGYKIKNINRQNYILKSDNNPIHDHQNSSTVRVKFRRNWKYYNKSRKYYCKKYLKIGLFKRFILNVCIFFSNIEAFIISLLKR